MTPTKKIKVMDNAKAGAEVRKLRNKSDMTLADLADKLSISIVYLSDLERGRRNWSLEMFAKAKKFTTR